MFKDPKDEKAKLLRSLIEAIEDHELQAGDIHVNLERGTVQFNLKFEIKGDKKK
jgi:hypothetical protein